MSQSFGLASVGIGGEAMTMHDLVRAIPAGPLRSRFVSAIDVNNLWNADDVEIADFVQYTLGRESNVGPRTVKVVKEAWRELSISKVKAKTPQQLISEIEHRLEQLKDMLREQNHGNI